MTTLLVRGLDEEGPDDVVGAFAGEADVDPDAIGEIDLDGSTATVEVDDATVEAIIGALDGGRIGRSEVAVERYDEESAAVREYVTAYDALVEREREAEMERHEREIERLSGRERQAKGRAVLGADGRDEGEGLGGHRVKFVRDDGLPETEIGAGDLVMVSKRDPTRDDNPTGTVARVTGHSITVSFAEEPPGFVYDDGLRLDLYVNDVTFQRMQDAIAELPDADGALADLREVVVGRADPDDSDPVAVDGWHDEALDETQREAVEDALGAETFHLIHGPPGTGKTTTAVETIRQCVDRGESVLATAASNTAVDNLLEFLAAGGVDAVRVGHPARVTPTLREHTLDARLEDNETYRRSEELREEAFDLLDEAEDLTAPSGRWRRGLSDERIRGLADEGRGSRGIPPEKIEEMAEWLDAREEADERFERSDDLEEEAIEEELATADVICTTNSTAGSDLVTGTFDTLVIDEATQATEPSCLIPITHARRVIMAGDHHQLPPTIQSRAAARGEVDAVDPDGPGSDGLRETLFERLVGRAPRSMLRVQYRMHEAIMAFSGERFYDGELRADASVRERTLRDRGIDGDDVPGHGRVLDPDAPVTFVDTSGADAPERSREGSTSTENPREAEYVADLAETLLAAGLPPSDLAVISPYDDQVRRIDDRIDAEGLEVDTVDGFQGREKEVVLVSLVRSNERSEVGFLSEERRFNVSLTRAQSKAVVVGDAGTVTSEDVYDDFVDYARERAGGRVADLGS